MPGLPVPACRPVTDTVWPAVSRWHQEERGPGLAHPSPLIGCCRLHPGAAIGWRSADAAAGKWILILRELRLRLRELIPQSHPMRRYCAGRAILPSCTQSLSAGGHGPGGSGHLTVGQTVHQ